jgi:glycosyltransferase involved in cell wall biosynthesis
MSRSTSRGAPVTGSDWLVLAGPTDRDAWRSARVYCTLIHFDEPFGLSVVEAMATGTPVIAFSRGSMPELIANGNSRVAGRRGRP